MTARIYVACLASYNNGVLYGKWIDASTDVDAMQAEIAEMLRGSPFPNVTIADYEAAAINAGWIEKDGEWLDLGDPSDPIHADSAQDACEKDGLPPVMVPSAEEWAIHDHEGLGSDLGEYAGLEAVAKRVEIAEAAEDAGIPVAVLLEAMNGYDEDAEDFISDRYRGTAGTWEDMAAELLEETGELNAIPENLRNYFDYAAYSRDMRLGGDMSAYRDDESGLLYFFWNH